MKNRDKKLEELWQKWKKGEISSSELLEEMKSFYIDEEDFVKIDLDRKRRRGFPETIMGEGKSFSDLRGILKKFFERGEDLILLTRISKDFAEKLKKDFPELIYKKRARTLFYQKKIPEKVGKILIITAGTADIPVAEEARITAQLMGNNVEFLYDVGISGIHRFYFNREKIQDANVGIVVAGMEGALPSFVSGLVDYPIIAVPTSVGYGANLNGVATLLAMVNSCVPGLVVVNVDNGYGAAYTASMINKKASKGEKK